MQTVNIYEAKLFTMIIRSTVEGSNRVLPGGSWNNNARNCRVSNRNNNSPGNSNNNNGFRLVLVPAHRPGRIAATEQIVDLPLFFKGEKQIKSALLVINMKAGLILIKKQIILDKKPCKL